MRKSLASLVELGQSPLTDPRALGSSAVFHALVVLLASLTILNAAMPLGSQSTRPKALYTEIDPVDNREKIPPVPGEGGGSPGEIGGTSSVPFVSTVEGNKAAASDSRPCGRQFAGGDPFPQAKAPKQLSGLCPARGRRARAIIPGSGGGGGGWVFGGGSGGGAGRSIGPGTQFFGAANHTPLCRVRDRLLGQHGDAQLA